MNFAVIIAVGPNNQANVSDTIDSFTHYCPENCKIILVDDRTGDGTWELLRSLKDKRVVVLRNKEPRGYPGLVHTVAVGLMEAGKIPDLRLVLKTDTDALLTGHDLLQDAEAFARANPHAGIFGKHLIHFDGRSKTFSMHTRYLNRELGFPRRFMPGRSGYAPICRRAQKNGWGLGENIFGGGYFLTAECLCKMRSLGHLDTGRWPRTAIPEDVYFTMCALAAGFDRAHFAAPVGPLALAFDGLPAPVKVLAERGMKLIHTVDKGKFTSREENDGVTPREFFAKLRGQESL